MDEIIAKINAVSQTTFMLFSNMEYRSDSRIFHCWIERRHDGDEIKIKREGGSPLEALEAAWDAFRKLVTTGYEPQDLMPVLLVHEAERF